MSSEDDLDGRMGDEQGIDVGKVGKVDGRIKGRQVGLERINVASYSSAHQHHPLVSSRPSHPGLLEPNKSKPLRHRGLRVRTLAMDTWERDLPRIPSTAIKSIQASMMWLILMVDGWASYECPVSDVQLVVMSRRSMNRSLMVAEEAVLNR